jgi:hypothetical protein
VMRKNRWFFNVPDWSEIPPRCYLTRLGVFRVQKPGLIHQVLNFEYMKAGSSLFTKVVRKIKKKFGWR